MKSDDKAGVKFDGSKPRMHLLSEAWCRRVLELRGSAEVGAPRNLMEAEDCLDVVVRMYPTPHAAFLAVATILTFGAQKYTEGGWKTVPGAVKRYQNAYLRHIHLRRSGEILDSESGLPHIDHALCNLMFLWCLFSGEVTEVPEVQDE